MQDPAIISDSFNFTETSQYKDTDVQKSWKGQLHLHTINSVHADETPYDMVAAYKDAGFDWVNITDHNYATPDPGVTGILTIVGAEENIFNDDGYRSHMLVANIKDTIWGGPHQGDGQYAIDNSPWSGLAHPNVPDQENPPSDGWLEADLRSLKGWNALKIGNPLKPYMWDELLSEGRFVHGMYTDDAHSFDEMERGWVVIFADSLTTDNVIEALVSGRYYSSKGPILTISDDGTSITVGADELSNFYFIGEHGVILETIYDVTSASYKYVGDEVYVRCVVRRNSDKKWAFTNAVEIAIPPTSQTPTPDSNLIPGDANGDGFVDGVDYALWFIHFATSTSNGPNDGDFDSSGFVDGIDYAIWLINFGK